MTTTTEGAVEIVIQSKPQFKTNLKLFGHDNAQNYFNLLRNLLIIFIVHLMLLNLHI